MKVSYQFSLTLPIKSQNVAWKYFRLKEVSIWAIKPQLMNLRNTLRMGLFLHEHAWCMKREMSSPSWTLHSSSRFVLCCETFLLSCLSSLRKQPSFIAPGPRGRRPLEKLEKPESKPLLFGLFRQAGVTSSPASKRKFDARKQSITLIKEQREGEKGKKRSLLEANRKPNFYRTQASLLVKFKCCILDEFDRDMVLMPCDKTQLAWFDHEFYDITEVSEWTTAGNFPGRPAITRLVSTEETLSQ